MSVSACTHSVPGYDL